MQEVITCRGALPRETVVITPLRQLYWTQNALEELAIVTAAYGSSADAEIMRSAHVEAIERKSLTDHITCAAVIAHFAEVAK